MRFVFHLPRVRAAITPILAASAALVACDSEDTPDPAPPGEDVITPADDTATPADDTTTPANDAATPADDAATPADDTATPADDTTTPADDAATPADDTTTPADDTTTPADDTSTPTPDAPYEVWATDQGLSRVIVWKVTPQLSGPPTIALEATVDYKALYPDLPAGSTDPKPPRTPHMVDFSKDGQFAFVAHTSSGHTTVIRTADKTVASVLPTGPGSHMVRVSPTGNVYVDVIGVTCTTSSPQPCTDFPGRILQLQVDDAGVASVTRTLIVRQDPLWTAGTFPGSSPVCGTSNADDTKQFVTFGPGFGQAMLARVDNTSFALEHIYDPTAIRANCGAIVGPDGRLYFTGGRPTPLDATSTGVGFWYIIDPNTGEPVPESPGGAVERTTHGRDAHGLAFAKDGGELWIVNRDSDNIAILDGTSHTLLENLEGLVDAPDLLALSPDGAHFFVTLRGPDPRSGTHAIAGSTPGIAVLDVATREKLTVLVTPSDIPTAQAGSPSSDYHGLRVRTLTAD
jgi:hypothetical protein